MRILLTGGQVTWPEQHEGDRSQRKTSLGPGLGFNIIYVFRYDSVPASSGASYKTNTHIASVQYPLLCPRDVVSSGTQ